MTKEELERYAVDNRARLEAQQVMMGDVVKILRGELAGENGVVVGIIALDKNDYTDPYFEVEMNCEVPDKYKCRKHTLNPRNIVGGFTACDFEVIGNRAPNQSTDKIKIGDRANTPKGEGKVINVVNDSLLVELADDEWWFCPHYIQPVQLPTATDTFDEKIRLGYALQNLKDSKARLLKLKEKNPHIVSYHCEALTGLEPLVYPDKEAWGVIGESCVNILDVYIRAIDREFDKLKAEFEKL